MDGAGGIGAVSHGITELAIVAVVGALVLFGVWKLVKLIWTAFGG